jgi:hypothetical protein
MRNHTQSYFDLNPKPTAWALLASGLRFVALAAWAALCVWGLTFVLFSF